MPRRLGQHFLTRGSVIHKILMSLNLHADDSVLEIGPGRGALTMPLTRKVGRLLLVEKDTHLAELLRRRLDGQENVSILEGDFLSISWEEVIRELGASFKVVSNLPYQVSTAILTKLLSHAPPGTLMILMFQKEVADRLLASPGTKAYGSLSVFTQMVSDVRHLLDAKPHAFTPPPKVDSSVLRFSIRERPLIPREEWAAFEELLHSGFRQRRKMLRQNLKSFFQKNTAEQIEARLTAVGATSRARAEELSLAQWLKLFRS